MGDINITTKVTFRHNVEQSLFTRLAGLDNKQRAEVIRRLAHIGFSYDIDNPNRNIVYSKMITPVELEDEKTGIDNDKPKDKDSSIDPVMFSSFES